MHTIQSEIYLYLIECLSKHEDGSIFSAFDVGNCLGECQTNIINSSHTTQKFWGCEPIEPKLYLKKGNKNSLKPKFFSLLLLHLAPFLSIMKNSSELNCLPSNRVNFECLIKEYLDLIKLLASNSLLISKRGMRPAILSAAALFTSPSGRARRYKRILNWSFYKQMQQVWHFIRGAHMYAKKLTKCNFLT